MGLYLDYKKMIIYNIIILLCGVFPMKKKLHATAIVFLLLLAILTSAIYGTADENNGSLLEIRNQLRLGNIAVVHYNTTNGITFMTDDGTYKENSPVNGEMSLEFTKKIDDKLVRNDENGIYLTGTYDNSALVFYVRETESEFSRLQIAVSCIDEKMYFASVGSQDEPDINTTLRLGMHDGVDYRWKEMLSDCTVGGEQYLTIDYTMCPYDESKNAYQIVLRADDGMACFTKVELTGLELVNISGDRKDISYKNGTIAKEHDASVNADYLSIKEQMDSQKLFSADTASSLIRNFLQRLYGFVLEITAILRSIFMV